MVSRSFMITVIATTTACLSGPARETGRPPPESRVRTSDRPSEIPRGCAEALHLEGELRPLPAMYVPPTTCSRLDQVKSRRVRSVAVAELATEHDLLAVYPCETATAGLDLQQQHVWIVGWAGSSDFPQSLAFMLDDGRRLTLGYATSHEECRGYGRGSAKYLHHFVLPANRQLDVVFCPDPEPRGECLVF